MHRLCLVLSSVLWIAVIGCDDDPPDETDCSYVQDPCANLGDQRCSDRGDTIEICQVNMELCNIWGTDESCGSNQRCEGGSNPTCVCENTCETPGEEQCDGTNAMNCTVDGFDCRYWNVEVNCSTGGGTCEVIDGDAQCTVECDDSCSPDGATRCNSSFLQTCTIADEGCLEWTVTTDCAEEGGTCDDSGDVPECDYTCSDACPTIDQTRCVGELIQTCVMGSEGCHEWSDGTDCATMEPPQFCVVAETGAECVDECVDRCPAVDDLGCNLDMVSTCQISEYGCLDWEVTEDCTLIEPPMVCDDTGETPTCVLACSDECPAADDTHCVGDVIQACTLAASGCLEWLTGLDCAALEPAQECDDSSGTASCVTSCVDACPSDGALQCSGDLVEVCGTGSSGCLEWSTQTDCSLEVPPQTCNASSGTPTCASSCSDSCPSDGDLQCNLDAVEVCGTGSSGCLEWSVQTDCTALVPAQECDDSGTPTCVESCTDSCPSDGALQCNADAVEVCGTGTSGCLEWSVQTDCTAIVPAQVCDDAVTPTCVCVDQCTLDDRQCNVDLIELCATGASGCLEWTLEQDCSIGIPPETCIDTGTPVCD